MWKNTVKKYDITLNNIQNSNEIRYCVNIQFKSYIVQNYVEIPNILTANPNVRKLVTVIEYISASNCTVPTFIILPSINIIENYINNCLNRYNVIITSPNGYTND